MDSAEIREFFHQEIQCRSINASNRRGVVKVDFQERARIPDKEENAPDIRAVIRINDRIKRRRPIDASLV